MRPKPNVFVTNYKRRMNCLTVLRKVATINFIVLLLTPMHAIAEPEIHTLGKVRASANATAATLSACIKKATADDSFVSDISKAIAELPEIPEGCVAYPSITPEDCTVIQRQKSDGTFSCVVACLVSLNVLCATEGLFK